jgi:hypothetical protein
MNDNNKAMKLWSEKKKSFVKFSKISDSKITFFLK